MAKQLVLDEDQANEVKRLVDYLIWGHGEGDHYASDPQEDHIFHCIKKVNSFLHEPFDLSQFEEK